MNWLKTHRNDVLLVAGLLILGGALALFLYATRQAGGYVSVRVDGELLMELPLSEDTQVALGEGEHTNTLVIENGTARVVEASCPDQICVNQGAVRYAGESIVCLPHKLVVTVEGGQANDVDATAK
ncbi:MAG: NusG domain II-containing protein [Clostridiales bacterium]|nr:NusG domain II-containing protein [Clostridiales bacterium]